MMKLLIIYDDTVRRNDAIRDVIGEKGFADVVVRKKRLSAYYQQHVKCFFPSMRWIPISSSYSFRELSDKLSKKEGDNYRVIHCFSNFIFTDECVAARSFKKIGFITEPYKAMVGDKVAALFFHDLESYKEYLQNVDAAVDSIAVAQENYSSFPLGGMADISSIDNFIQCITGHADARFFNSLQGDDYTITKSSANKKKIKSEYMFYHLLPDDMKMWFVMPFDYRETDDKASYTMERMHMTDLAIKWVHGSIDHDEFIRLLNRYFHFFQSRHKKSISKEAYKEISDKLYVEKVKSRISELKELPQYQQISQLLCASNNMTIDDIEAKYFDLKEKIETRHTFEPISVIGHGDPCFANALYNKSTQMLKFIDPKGAQTEEELWTNPYYDIAKLSHSICGNYDFFNNGLFEIQIDNKFNSKLTIDFDNTAYIQLFKDKVEENGYYFDAVRLYEASLFISMLPLHIDNPYKVYGFILNAVKILKEVESYV